MLWVGIAMSSDFLDRISCIRHSLFVKLKINELFISYYSFTTTCIVWQLCNQIDSVNKNTFLLTVIGCGLPWKALLLSIQSFQHIRHNPWHCCKSFQIGLLLLSLHCSEYFEVIETETFQKAFCFNNMRSHGEKSGSAVDIPKLLYIFWSKITLPKVLFLEGALMWYKLISSVRVRIISDGYSAINISML